MFKLFKWCNFYYKHNFKHWNFCFIIEETEILTTNMDEGKLTLLFFTNDSLA